MKTQTKGVHDRSRTPIKTGNENRATNRSCEQQSELANHLAVAFRSEVIERVEIHVLRQEVNRTIGHERVRPPVWNELMTVLYE